MTVWNRALESAGRAWRRSVSIALALHQHDAPLKAGAMAFDLFLGLLPLAAIAGWALAHVYGRTEHGVFNTVIDIAPGPAAELVHEQIRRLVEHGGTIAPVSIIGFIWIAASGIHTAMSAIQSARTGHTRSWFLNRAISIGVVVVTLLLLTSSTAAIIFVETWLRRNLVAGNIESELALLARSGTFLFGIAVTTVGVASFFYISTRGMESHARHTIWPGALGFATLWTFVSWLFSAYVTALGRYSLFYGSLAAVALLMIWLWISSFLLLVGFELNLQLEGRRETIVPPTLRLFPRRAPQPQPDVKSRTPDP
ncbi:MAG TPA: YihY/virulence factor BrkB family protein [Polyangiaceae bacterium]|nr:YihY/virulence factor BrkB family protein [Polyangiaceae bacterium]